MNYGIQSYKPRGNPPFRPFNVTFAEENTFKTNSAVSVLVSVSDMIALSSLVHRNFGPAKREQHENNKRTTREQEENRKRTTRE